MISEEISKGEICPYCSQPSELIESKELYGVDYGLILICKPCKAWVGTHKKTNKGLGMLANAFSRKLKIKAHSAFDRLWNTNKMTRREAYAWLSKEMKIDPRFCHIGMFSVAQCKRVIKISYNKVPQEKVKVIDFSKF